MYLLNDGNRIPKLGLGCWNLREETEEVIREAVKMGYRLLDTAAYYENEELVGEGIRTCGLPRSELFVTTKVWPSEMGSKDSVRRSLEARLKRLGLEYLDLFLLHWPIGAVSEAWATLEQAQAEGLVKSIGVSNFRPVHLDELLKTAHVCPTVNQIEFNPSMQTRDAWAHSIKLGILPQAWGPLGKGNALTHPTVLALAKKYGITPAQLLLGWELQLGFCVIPKSKSPQRLQENLDAVRLTLTEAELSALAELNTGKTDRFYPYEFDPNRFGIIPEGGLRPRD